MKHEHKIIIAALFILAIIVIGTTVLLFDVKLNINGTDMGGLIFLAAVFAYVGFVLVFDVGGYGIKRVK